MDKKAVAELLDEIAVLLEIIGENPFKTRAYANAARALLAVPGELDEIVKATDLKGIKGIGEGIRERVLELVQTGRMAYYDELKASVPAGLMDMLRIPGLGPKKAKAVYDLLGVKSIGELEYACHENRLVDLPGFGVKTQEKILQGIAFLKKHADQYLYSFAFAEAEKLIQPILKSKKVVQASVAGSIRRKKEVTKDIDIVVATDDPASVMDLFTTLPDVEAVTSKGDTKSSIEFGDGVRAQVWVHPPERFGTALLYATGSKDHNVRLRELALEKGLSLSEHALTKQKGDGKEMLYETEEQVYAALGLPWIPPELREDRGEIQAAKANKLPKLIELKDIKADLQVHSNWSDGKLTMLDMARAEAKRGMKVVAFTDHSVSLGVTGGLSMEAHKQQAAEIRQAQKKLGDTIQILHASEVEIKADGKLDYPDDFLKSLDLVLASLHTSLRQPREKVTQRVLNAIKNPNVDIIGHPTGRLIPDREGADLDMDALLQAAAKSGVAMEINAHPARLDLDDMHARRAKELGIPISINTDAHSEADLNVMFYGVATARRAWLEAKDVINTWPKKKLLDWLAKRHGRK